MPSVKKQSEQMGEGFAYEVLTEQFGAETFIGSGVEDKLREHAPVIYQNIPDLLFYGATVSFGPDDKYVMLNTHQPLRSRYYTAAHELWHVLDFEHLMSDQLDMERAADRFAAALMMPRAIIRLLWPKLKKKLEAHKAVILIADMAAVPYEAVVRRIHELDLPISTGLLKITDAEWKEQRGKLSLPASPFDEAYTEESFERYANIVDLALEQDKLSLLEASGLLAHIAPQKAREYQEVALTLLATAEASEDKEE
ncbi:Zn-dependent peptidase ImmA (M78 family) [Paenibacillus forsythiae]|uniref:Zn-dependent peptidase ImmA (M78 family) n=1 Tax=Paenibacillus forsythiae TaxID=365616 RepID=A0ABU3H654_9BACL|nr:ImmA/IrrE family metallo-endopeptidase [Paenibacillus forsythiae]MDT3425205.1 Zn-dependent peptidase ImmA (M78 family) [Paenibacillus forsythiae]